MPMSKKDLLAKVEALKPGDGLKLAIHATFGGGTSLVTLNTKFPEKGEKKYEMRWVKDGTLVKDVPPYVKADKAKDIAGWLADRWADVAP